jgi:DNA replication protein DnaC
MGQLARTDLLILDDWGLHKLNAAQRNDLMELIEDRHGLRATLIASQLPVEHWHELIGEATLADAILDRLLHNAHRLTLTGESMRRSAPERIPALSTPHAARQGQEARLRAGGLRVDNA